MKISYLGPEGTFSYEACCKYSNGKLELIQESTITDCIISLEKNLVDLAIVPIENSLQGGVTEAIDKLINTKDIYVIDEVLLDIKQNLLSKNNIKINDITKVFSHTQAISQCRNYLSENNLLDKVITVDSTSKGALLVSEDLENSACICNITCLDKYNLNLLEEGIQDNKSNQTKFWVLSKNKNNNKVCSKMSMFFSVKDHPGALFSALQIFNVLNINLTRIESRPAKTTLGEYYFLIELDLNDNCSMAIKLLEDNNIKFRVLGKY